MIKYVFLDNEGYVTSVGTSRVLPEGAIATEIPRSYNKSNLRLLDGVLEEVSDCATINQSESNVIVYKHEDALEINVVVVDIVNDERIYEGLLTDTSVSFNLADSGTYQIQCEYSGKDFRDIFKEIKL